MPRFYLPPEKSSEPTVFLTGSEAHHAMRVLRVRRNDRVGVIDGAGSELECLVTGYDRDKVQLSVVKRTLVPPLPWEITLLQALPKGKIFETIIQKATELGVFRIIPIISERAVSSVNSPRDKLAKTEKWRTVAIEATKQCGSAWLPQIEMPTTPAEFLKRPEKFDLPFVASLHEGARHTRAYFETFRVENKRNPRSLCIWVGPEGDFTPREIELITAAGHLPISLGRLVLRVETAATYCLSILNYELLSRS